MIITRHYKDDTKVSGKINTIDEMQEHVIASDFLGLVIDAKDHINHGKELPNHYKVINPIILEMLSQITMIEIEYDHAGYKMTHKFKDNETILGGKGL